MLGLEMPSGYLVRWSEVGSLSPEPRGSMERRGGGGPLSTQDVGAAAGSR